MDERERIHEIAKRKGKKALYATLASTVLLFSTTEPFLDMYGVSTKEIKRNYWSLFETERYLEREIGSLENEKNDYVRDSKHIPEEIKRKLDKFAERSSLEAKIKDAKDILRNVKLEINRPEMQDYRFENASKLALSFIPYVFFCLYINRLAKRRDQEVANIKD